VKRRQALRGRNHAEGNLVGSSQTMTNRAVLIDFDASLPTVIGSKDPHALKIPARRAEC